MAKIKFTTTIDDEILRYLKVQSASEGISVGTLIEKMFDQYPEKISISTPKKDGTILPPEKI